MTRGEPVLLAALLVACSALLALALSRSDRVLPGVTVAGQQLGGMPMTDAAIAVSRAWDAHVVVVVAGGRSFTTTLPALGFRLDPSATAWAAYQRGRTMSSIRTLVSGMDPRSVPPMWSLDPVAASAALADGADEVDIAPVDADLVLHEGRVEVRQAVQGEVMDRAATLLRLQAESVSVVNTGRLEAVMLAIPAVERDVRDAAAEANRRLAGDVDVRAYDPVHDREVMQSVAPEAWSRWVGPAIDPRNPRVVVWRPLGDVPREALRLPPAEWSAEHYLDGPELAEATAKALSSGNEEARVLVRHAPVMHEVRMGETVAAIAEQYGIPYPYVLAANEGLGNEVWPGQDIEIPSPDPFVPLPVIQGKRVVVSLSEQRLEAIEDGRVRWQWPVSTGIASSPTSPGVFQVQSHEPNAYASNWDLWMPHFVGIYRPLPGSEFMNGFHGFPTRDGRSLLWTGSLGHAATYGCVLVSSENAAQLYEWAEPGVVVEIRR